MSVIEISSGAPWTWWNGSESDSQPSASGVVMRLNSGLSVMCVCVSEQKNLTLIAALPVSSRIGH